ncbi:hypothetical protein F4779DRAFT_246484 [Xylariaceae sp. FL0662B]|nr:hypothetical protein F4779DRAFT_246484 [Xylariaceae sp. FL0662B]
MDESPNFFSYCLQDDEGSSYDIFDGQGTTNQDDQQEEQLPGTYADDFPVDAAPTQNHSSDPLAVASLPVQTSTTSSKRRVAARNARRQLPSSRANSVKFEPPDLSSGSSTTPETHSSQHIITPDGVPANHDGKLQDVSEADELPPPAPPAKRRRSRIQKAKENVDPREDEAKRHRFLERNRVAATKCRQKRKEWVSDLEETRFGLESQNTHLQIEYGSLVNEVCQIRAQLMTHASCNDSNIDKWIENEAKRFVLRAGEQYDHMLANFEPSPGLHLRQGSTSSGSGYAAAGSSLVSPTTPSHHGSFSFPSHGTSAVPNSPMFYRSDLSNMSSNGTTVSTEQSSYGPALMPNTVTEDTTDYDGMPMTDQPF